MDRVGYMPQDLNHNSDIPPTLNKHGEEMYSSEFNIRPDRKRTIALVALFGLASAGVATHTEVFAGKSEHQTSRESEKPDELLLEKFVKLEEGNYRVNFSGVFINPDRFHSHSSFGQETDSDERTRQFQIIKKLGKSFVRASYPAVANSKPLDYLNGRLDGAEEGDKKEIKVPAYELAVGQAASNIELRNLLTGKVVKRFDVDFSSNVEVDRVQAEVSEAIVADRENLVVAYSHLLESKHIPAEAMDITETHPGKGLKQIKDLLQHGNITEVRIEGWKTAGHDENDRKVVADFLSSYAGEIPDNGSVEIPGLLTDIYFRRFAEGSTPPDWAMQGGGTSMLLGEDGIVYTLETNIDIEKGTYEQIGSIKVPPAIGSNAGNTEGQFVVRSIDGVPAGLPSSLEIFERPENIIAQRENSGFKFDFYFEGTDEPTWEPYYDEIVKSIVKTQEAFYGDNTEFQLINKIRIVSDTQKDGFYQPRLSDTVAITSPFVQPPMLSGLAGNNEVRSVASHEFIHRIYVDLDLDQSKELNDLHQKLSKDDLFFFKVIAEGSWEGSGTGGHPQENPNEFFASFMHSLLADNLEATMIQKLNPASATQYIEALQGMRLVLVKAFREKGRSMDVSIFETLDQAEKIARNIILAGSDKQVASK